MARSFIVTAGSEWRVRSRPSQLDLDSDTSRAITGHHATATQLLRHLAVDQIFRAVETSSTALDRMELAAGERCADMSTIEMVTDRHVFGALVMPALWLSSIRQ